MTLSSIITFLKGAKNFIIIAYIVIVTILLFLFIGLNKKNRDTVARLGANQEALMTEVEYFKTQDGKNAAKVVELELTQGEFERLCNEQAQTIKSLKQKVKNLEKITTTSTETNINVNTTLKDTIVVKQVDTFYVKEPVKAFEWHDNWNKIEGLVYADDKVDVSYRGTDTLNIVATRSKRKCLFDPQYVEVYVTNKNEASKIVYLKTIRVQKRKK